MRQCPYCYKRLWDKADQCRYCKKRLDGSVTIPQLPPGAEPDEAYVAALMRLQCDADSSGGRIFWQISQPLFFDDGSKNELLRVPGISEISFRETDKHAEDELSFTYHGHKIRIVSDQPLGIYLHPSASTFFISKEPDCPEGILIKLILELGKIYDSMFPDRIDDTE